MKRNELILLPMAAMLWMTTSAQAQGPGGFGGGGGFQPPPAMMAKIPRMAAVAGPSQKCHFVTADIGRAGRHGARPANEADQVPGSNRLGHPQQMAAKARAHRFAGSRRQQAVDRPTDSDPDQKDRHGFSRARRFWRRSSRWRWVRRRSARRAWRWSRRTACLRSGLVPQSARLQPRSTRTRSPWCARGTAPSSASPSSKGR